MPNLPQELVANEIIIYIFMMIIIVFCWLFARLANKWDKKIDKMLDAVQHQEVLNAVNEDDHEYYNEKIKAHGDILGNHEKRITKIEYNNEKSL